MSNHLQGKDVLYISSDKNHIKLIFIFQEECYDSDYDKHCKKVPIEKCEQVPISVPKQIPTEECHKVEKKDCHNVAKKIPKESCHQVPK